MKIYTRRGDDGTTSLVGGTRISKSALRIEAYGTLDELTAVLGFLASNQFSYADEYREQLVYIISRVMDCAAIVASENSDLSKLPQIKESHILELERWCDNLLEGLPLLRHFTLPVGSAQMSYSHVCRTVARRAERAIVRSFESGDTIGPNVTSYINRLSDYLYALSRRFSFDSTGGDVLWIAGS